MTCLKTGAAPVLAPNPETGDVPAPVDPGSRAACCAAIGHVER
ncbi:hypothetical protein ACQKQD_26570 [Methylobacterium sp. NPDC080182]